MKNSRIQANLLKDRFIEYLIAIGDQEIHKERLCERELAAPGRKMQKYLTNFREIRWIHDFLEERAYRFDDIICIDNSGPIKKGVDRALQAFYLRT